MARRGVAPADLPDMRAMRLVFQHGLWATDAVASRIGLRQGCRLSHLVFRWVMEVLLGDIQAT